MPARLLMRSRRHVRDARILLGQDNTRSTFFVVLVLFLMVMGSHSGLRAEDRCEDAADKALRSARTWLDLRKWFMEFPECDDGYLAEGVSEYVTASLAKRWSELPKLMTEIRNTQQFDRFILGHVDATADYDNLKSILENATKRCPHGAKVLCGSIANSARKALKEPGVAPTPDQGRRSPAGAERSTAAKKQELGEPVHPENR